MKLYTRTRMLLIAVGWLLALLRAQAAETSLIAFELDGHDKQTYTERSWPGRPLMLFVSTRAAAEHNEGRVWSGPIAGATAAGVADVMLARVITLPDIPRLFAGAVRNAVAPADVDPIRLSLLDWSGLFAQRYELANDVYNVLLFDRDGKLLYSAALRAFDQARLDAELQRLQAAMEQL